MMPVSGFLFPYSHKIDIMVSSKYTCCLLSSKKTEQKNVLSTNKKENEHAKNDGVDVFGQ